MVVDPSWCLLLALCFFVFQNLEFRIQNLEIRIQNSESCIKRGMIFDHCKLTHLDACLWPFLTNVPSTEMKSGDAYLMLGLSPTQLPTLYIQHHVTWVSHSTWLRSMSKLINCREICVHRTMQIQGPPNKNCIRYEGLKSQLLILSK